MINNLNKSIEHTRVLVYADDTTIIVTVQNLKFMSININKH